MAAPPYNYDYTGTDGAAWAGWTIQSSGGTVDIQSNQGRLLTNVGTTTWVRADLLGVQTTTGNVDVTYDFYTSQPSVSGTYGNLGFMINSDNSAPGTNAGAGYYFFYTPNYQSHLSNLNVGLATSTSGTTMQTTVVPLYYGPNNNFSVRYRVLSDVIYYKVWYTDGTEPNAWANTYTPGGTIPSGVAEFYTNGLAAGATTFLVDNFAMYDPSLQTTVPGRVPNVTVSAGNTSATINFAVPPWDGGSAITSYTATINPGGITVSGNATSLRVTGLTNGTKYIATVQALNINGAGRASLDYPFTPKTVNSSSLPWRGM
ncbi:MAG: hypothetical protein JWN33_189 [Candidatus Saccharibacteria bacterium]|nr:hypothetical protein [Candidatus Saccharibacteria bacterium]